jgi:hypothetical protein
MTACKTLLLLSLLAKLQELPVSQLAIHVNPFHLVITDKQRPVPGCSLGGTSSLPHGVTPPIKLPTIPAELLHSGPKSQPSSLAPNKCFFSTRGAVSVQQFLTSGAKTQERLTECCCPGLVPWLSCPALSRTQTAELTPHVYGLWISDLTALLAPHPPLASLPLLFT